MCIHFLVTATNMYVLKMMDRIDLYLCTSNVIRMDTVATVYNDPTRYLGGVGPLMYHYGYVVGISSAAQPPRDTEKLLTRL